VPPRNRRGWDGRGRTREASRIAHPGNRIMVSGARFPGVAA
jgi:hypothetical protein